MDSFSVVAPISTPPATAISEVHPATYDISDERDRFEIDLMNGAVNRDLPVLCICRGIQVLNVALGGSLVQHIDDQVEHRWRTVSMKPAIRRAISPAMMFSL